MTHPTAPLPEYLRLTGVRESIVVPDGQPSLGAVAEFTDALYDAAGRRVGTATGHSVVIDTTPCPRLLHRTVTELPDGAVETLDVTDAGASAGPLAGTAPVTGISGRYAGRTGHRTLVPGVSSRYALTIVLR